MDLGGPFAQVSVTVGKSGIGSRPSPRGLAPMGTSARLGTPWVGRCASGERCGTVLGVSMLGYLGADPGKVVRVWSCLDRRKGYFQLYWEMDQCAV